MSRTLDFSFIVPLCLFLGLWQMQIQMVHMEILTRRSGAKRSVNFIKSNYNEHKVEADSITEPADIVNTDFMDKISWNCANNGKCINNLTNSLWKSYRRGETINFGLFDVVKLPYNAKATHNFNLTESGRSMSKVMDFINGNAVRIPIGPMVFSIQRSMEDSNYLEVALLKKSKTQGRARGDNKNGDDGLELRGETGHGGGRGRRRRHDKKQLQMLIPMYLAATTFGWTLVAAKAVGLLTLKALIVSKLAFIVAALVIIKKLMDSASEKMLYQFPEHPPYMMPYSMEYPMHSMGGAEIAADGMYPAALQLAAAAAPLPHHTGHSGLENLAAESNLHHNVADVHNNTQVLAALNAAGLGPKIKREDSWMAKTSSARHPLMYNYLQPQNPYYVTQ
ncbi:uncharacterized protein LOC119676255 [Teleopsis dalmanni]|uniref:uncharacterized protein LOC119676255 n=1 Tax=Teleopsis dalmanni TaxID=139649 RepID=UPI0018CC98F6|nr:uncharacterized protein LOC119676255 [Teleopsis dalmanni]